MSKSEGVSGRGGGEDRDFTASFQRVLSPHLCVYVREEGKWGRGGRKQGREGGRKGGSEGGRLRARAKERQRDSDRQTDRQTD